VYAAFASEKLLTQLPFTFNGEDQSGKLMQSAASECNEADAAICRRKEPTSDSCQAVA
jgi:hypothetical protein